MLKKNKDPLYKINERAIEYFFTIEEKNGLYKRLRKKHGPEWKYYNHRKNPIVTKLNNLGYRSNIELPPEDQDYYLMLGDSNSYGEYLHWEDTAAYLLEKELGVPVLNASVPGGAANAMSLNLQKLMLSNFRKPKVIFAQWPPVARYTVFGNGCRATITAQMAEIKVFKFMLRKNELFEINGLESFNYVNSIKGIPVINYAVNDDSSEFYSIPFIKRIDTARDDSHCGTMTNQLIAQHIKNELKNV